VGCDSRERRSALAASGARCGRARARGLIITALHRRRWDSDFLGMRAAIEAGTIGQVVHFESRFDRFRPAPRDRWREDGAPGSGIWYDLGPHLVDQALVLFGAPLRVSADLAILRPGGQAHDWAHVTLHYAHARVIVQASMCVAGGLPRFIAHGLTGSLIKPGADVQEAQSVAGLTPAAVNWGLDPDPIRHIDAHGREHLIAAPRGHQPTFYADLASACLGRSAPPNTPDQILMVQTILDAAMMSARTGMTMTL